MRRGKDLHVAIERALLSQPAVGDRPEVLHAYRWATERWSVLHCETPIGIDPTNGTARQYDTKDDIPDDHVAVVVDVHSREAAAVYDWKTGSQFSSFSYAPQVKLNGYAVAALLGVEDVESGLAYVSAHGITAKSWLLDAFDLARQRQQLRLWAAQAPTAEPTPCAACKWCPARAICPAMVDKEAKWTA